jgi:hypothetical protein
MRTLARQRAEGRTTAVIRYETRDSEYGQLLSEHRGGNLPRVSSNTTRSGSNRFRLPGIKQLGYAQLSVIETALSPLDPSLLNDSFFETRYHYTNAQGERQQADVRVGYAFEPLKPNDDFILWSLLSLTLQHSDNHILTATPYWLLKNLGMFTGGHQYQVLRDAVERLSQLFYRNTGFYNPMSQTHERWQFAFSRPICRFPWRRIAFGNWSGISLSSKPRGQPAAGCSSISNFFANLDRRRPVACSSNSPIASTGLTGCIST